MTKIQKQIISTLISGGKLGLISGTLSDSKGKFIRHIHYRSMKTLERDGVIILGNDGYEVSSEYKNRLSIYQDPENL